MICQVTLLIRIAKGDVLAAADNSLPELRIQAAVALNDKNRCGNESPDSCIHRLPDDL